MLKTDMKGLTKKANIQYTLKYKGHPKWLLNIMSDNLKPSFKLYIEENPIYEGFSEILLDPLILLMQFFETF